MAKAALAEVDADVVADEVFRSLNSIQIGDLRDNSGKTYGGYKEPTTEIYRKRKGDTT